MLLLRSDESCSLCSHLRSTFPRTISPTRCVCHVACIKITARYADCIYSGAPDETLGGAHAPPSLSTAGAQGCRPARAWDRRAYRVRTGLNQSFFVYVLTVRHTFQLGGAWTSTAFSFRPRRLMMGPPTIVLHHSMAGAQNPGAGGSQCAGAVGESASNGRDFRRQVSALPHARLSLTQDRSLGDMFARWTSKSSLNSFIFPSQR
jgi:hypothetical protein